MDNLISSIVTAWLSLKRKNEIHPYFTANSKINYTWTACVKTKIFTLLEENVEGYHYSYDQVGKNFSDSPSAASNLILSTFTRMHFYLTIALMM